MKHREFLKSMAAMIGLLAAGCGPVKEEAEQGSAGREYDAFIGTAP